MRPPITRFTIGLVLLLWTLLALAGAGALFEFVGAARDRRRFSAPGVFIDAAGQRLHTMCSGSGSPAVLLESGIAASSLSWAFVQPSIAEFTRVCAYDRAGLAWSDPPTCARTVDAMLRELHAVVEHTAPHEACVLVGHSFGSLIVRAYAARHPARVAALVLVDPPTEWTMPRDERQARILWGGRQLSVVGAWLARAGVVRLCLMLLTGGAPAATRGFVRVFGPTAATTLSRIVGEVRKLPAELYPVVQALWCQPKCFRSMAAHLATLELEGTALAAAVPPPHIQCVVISSGGLTAERLASHRHLAGSAIVGRHLVADRSAHWVQFDQPELIVQVVHDIVRERNG